MENTLPAVAASAGIYLAVKYLDDRFAFSNDIKLAARNLGWQKFLTDKAKTGWNMSMQWYDTLSKVDKNKTCIASIEGTSFTYQEVENLSNRVAHWARAQGLKFGDVIAQMLENRPEYLITWLGFCKAGVAIAFINFNLRKKALMHCISVSKALWLIAGTECAPAVDEVRNELQSLNVRIVFTGSDPMPSFGENFDMAVSKEPTTKLPREIITQPTLLDTFGYVYTSGTTGLPKAAIIKHHKQYAFGALVVNTFLVRSDDRLFTALPLYHSSAGGVGMGPIFLRGATVIVTRKFSASRFFQEANQCNATVIQYIGELCRYLLSAPPSEWDKKHRIRLAFGNGIRPDIWSHFQERFNIPEIGEFYGATEGNLSLVNHCTSPAMRGYCGRMGVLGRMVLGFKVVKFDIEKEEPIRDKNGHCIECAYDEPGELLAPIDYKNPSPTSRFEGYSDKKAGEKKIISNVFKQGDKYFRSGDLVARTKNQYYYFVDRIGDTFRWKGENVSTNEVADHLGEFPGIQDANVYGVQIPGMDGRACMAACVMDSNIDLDKFLDYIKKHLPSYAIPLFFRKIPAPELTSTFKLQKFLLREQGIDPSKVTDPMLWLNPNTKKYEPFGQNEYQQLLLGKAKL